MDATWMDDRPVAVACGQCGVPVHTTAQMRGTIYCPVCRQDRRTAALRRAAARFQQRKLAARSPIQQPSDRFSEFA
jgi:uncharacterized Zn finger protein (UPF0148 family)